MRGKWILGGLALAAAAGTLAESRVRIVRVNFLAGEVEVSQPGTGGVAPWQPALLNAPVVEAEKIRTLAAGEAEVQLECGSALRLAPNSELAFPRLRLKDSGVRDTTVAVGSGTAFFAVRRADSPDFRVDLPGGAVETPEGAASFRIEAPAEGAATVELTAGHARFVAGRRGAFELRTDARLKLPASGAPVFEAEAVPDRWTQWNRDRDQVFQRSLDANQPTPSIDASQSKPSNPVAYSSGANPPGSIPTPSPSAQAIEINPAGVFADLDAGSGMRPIRPAFGGRRDKVPFCANN